MTTALTVVIADDAPRTRQGWRRAARAIVGLFVLACVVWAWPSRFGGHTTVLAVDGNSMKPTFDNGDLVVARTEDRYSVGDVIIFTVPTTAGHFANIVHRIIAVNSDGSIVTQGDNRQTADGFHTTIHNVVGRAEWSIPQGATALRIMARWWVLAIVAGALVTALLWPRDDEDAAQPSAPEE